VSRSLRIYTEKINGTRKVSLAGLIPGVERAENGKVLN